MNGPASSSPSSRSSARSTHRRDLHAAAGSERNARSDRRGLRALAALVAAGTLAAGAAVVVGGAPASNPLEGESTRVDDPAPAGQSEGRTFLWEVHDKRRPQPPIVQPAPAGAPVPPPADAVVLVAIDPAKADATLSAWRSGDAPPRWTIERGAESAELVVAPGTGDLRTAASFGDVQAHIEWMVPADRPVDGQSGGNSGIFFLDRYELQILASHGNRTYADGMAGSLYGQYPPLANPSRPQGEWNVYDVVFRGPVFRADGSVERPATMTVFFNGVLVQDDVELLGATAHAARASYSKHDPIGPIRLQDHGDPIRFRNVWVRPLEPRKGPE
jgi:hypothetical protein